MRIDLNASYQLTPLTTSSGLTLAENADNSVATGDVRQANSLNQAATSNAGNADLGPANQGTTTQTFGNIAVIAGIQYQSNVTANPDDLSPLATPERSKTQTVSGNLRAFNIYNQAFLQEPGAAAVVNAAKSESQPGPVARVQQPPVQDFSVPGNSVSPLRDH